MVDVETMFQHRLWFNIPQHCREGLRRYVEHGVPTGHFLEALLSNDLRETYARADDENGRHVRDYVMWLYNEAPCGCWGSPEKYRDWLAQGGMSGRERRIVLGQEEEI
jgi:hypothetical protein